MEAGLSTFKKKKKQLNPCAASLATIDIFLYSLIRDEKFHRHLADDSLSHS